VLGRGRGPLVGLDARAAMREATAMARLMLRSLWVLAPMLLVACHSPKPKQVGESTDYGTSAPSTSTAGASEGEGEGDTSASPATTKQHLPPPVPDDYELTPADCAALSNHYRELLRATEMQKLEAKKLPPKMRPSAEAQVEKAVETGYDRWVKACDAIVNKVRNRDWLQCAQDANDLERFNGCWEGKFDAEKK
jgi:hypothetical protein